MISKLFLVSALISAASLTACATPKLPYVASRTERPQLPAIPAALRQQQQLSESIAATPDGEVRAEMEATEKFGIERRRANALARFYDCVAAAVTTGEVPYGCIERAVTDANR